MIRGADGHCGATRPDDGGHDGTRNQQPGARPTRNARIATANGFVAIVLGLALLAGGALMLLAIADRRLSGVGPVRVGIVVLIAGRADAGRPVHAAAQRGGDPAALRRLPAAPAACPGLRATNPFYSRKKISLRARNLNGDKLKVNDKRGNPIEIAAVVVWHVEDSAKAAFDVDDYEMFVKVQSESAVRHLASSFAYDAEES